MLATILSTLIGVIIGGLLTWIVAKAYYEKAGQELRHETARLQSLTKFLGIKLHENEIIKLPLDKAGRPTYNQTISPTSID